MDWFINAFSAVQQTVFEAAIQPLVFALGFGALVEDAFAATGWLLIGMGQLLVIAVVFGALQRWRPVEPVTDRATIRTDIAYTLIHRLGVFRLGLFFAVDLLFDVDPALPLELVGDAMRLKQILINLAAMRSSSPKRARW